MVSPDSHFVFFKLVNNDQELDLLTVFYLKTDIAVVASRTGF